MVKRFLIAVVVIGTFLGGLAWFQLQFKPAMIKGFLAKQQPPPSTITAEAARTEDWIERLPAIGTLISSQGVDVGHGLLIRFQGLSRTPLMRVRRAHPPQDIDFLDTIVQRAGAV